MYYVILPEIIQQMKVNIPHRPLSYAYMKAIIKELATLNDNLRRGPFSFIRLLLFLDGRQIKDLLVSVDSQILQIVAPP